MQLTVKGRHIDVGDAFRGHAETSLTTVLGKYFGDAIEAGVTLAREAHMFRATIAVHIGRGMQVQAAGAAAEVYPAFDQAVDHLSKRLRRYKRRLRDHHLRSQQETEETLLLAQQYVLAAEETETEPEPDGDELMVVAEMQTEIPNLTVSEAVMRLDLAEAPAMMFRNRAHGGLNMIYRRSDGNVGWIDPRGNRGN